MYSSVLDFPAGPLCTRAANLPRSGFKAQYICIYESKREKTKDGYRDTDLKDERGEHFKKGRHIR